MADFGSSNVGQISTNSVTWPISHLGNSSFLPLSLSLSCPLFRYIDWVMKLAFCLLIASSIFTLSSAITPDPRFKHGKAVYRSREVTKIGTWSPWTGCVALKQKIYCYGGGQYVSGGINYNKVLKDHLVLDLSRDFLVQDAQSAWTALSTPSNFTLEPNYSYGYTVLSPTSYLITSGSGYNDGKTYLKNKTTVYHADSNQWESVSTIANQS